MEFSHTYIMHEIFDEEFSQDSIWNLNSSYYRMIPHENFIDYEACDGTHTWRIHTVKNKFGNLMAEFKRDSSGIFDTGFQIL